MQRNDFLVGVTAMGLLAGSESLIGAYAPSQAATSAHAYAKVFQAELDAIANLYPDSTTFHLLKRIAALPNVTPEQLEVAWGLLGPYGQMPDVPQAIPSAPALQFPADHAWHMNASIEWYYYTMSLPLRNGGLLSVVCSLFRKTLAPASLVPGTPDLGRTIFSTSIATTIHMPGAKPVHYAWPVQTFFGEDVHIQINPFTTVVGKQSIRGGVNVFPLHLHLEDPGDASVGRPSTIIDVDCAASNPLFLQGVNGYVGSPLGSPQTVGYYYYSWPQQATSGHVTIGGTSYEVADGLTWMDHQWGGNPPAKSGPVSVWSGWSWFEFQFEGGRSLTLSNTHGPIASGIAVPNPGFGTYIDDSAGVTELVGSMLTINGYTPSPNTTARYPNSWMLTVGALNIPGANSPPLRLRVTPVAAIVPQALWMGGLVEYAEAATAVTASGTINGKPVTLSGVGYCESVGFEDNTLLAARQRAYLQSTLQKT